MFDGMRPEFADALRQFLAAAPGAGISITSGFRTPERQAQLWQAALAKHGSEAAARRWVAPPGRSKHNHGTAADLRYASPDTLKWAHENAGRFGLHFPLSNENWHVEPVGSRGGSAPPAAVQTAEAGPGVTPGPAPAPEPAGPIAAPAPVVPAGALASLFVVPDLEEEQRRREAEDRQRRLLLFG